MTARAAALAALAALAAPSAARAQDAAAPAADELELFQLDAALAKETTVASRRARTIRETPGVVTVLSRDEILASGARDLAELLRRVPGFQLGVDVESTIGLGFRGIWGHEGKVLVLVDGFEMNDLLYGTVPFGDHFLLDQVESVEIVRGPGSAAYGGHAELAVVNVTTRAAAISGGAVSGGGGRFARATSALYGTAAAGAGAGELRLGAVATLGVGNRSDRTFTDLGGASYDMAKASEANPGMVSAHAAWRGLAVRFFYDDYRTTNRDAYGVVVDPAEKVRWRAAAGDARWDLRVNDRLTITPRITYRWEIPWQQPDPADPDTYYDTTAQRVTGRLSAAWDPAPAVSVAGGVEAYREEARVNHPGVATYDYGGKRSVSYAGAAAFAEVGLDAAVANVLAGARWDWHEKYGSAFAPRLALTRVLGRFHLKGLASGAYRAPSIENINYAVPGTTLKAERTRVFEAEAGWQASNAVYAAVNVFDIAITRPIVFTFLNCPLGDCYANEGETGSRGVEADLRFQLPFGAASVAYGFYTSRGRNEIAAYAVPGHPELLLGFAGHEVVATAQLRAWRDLVVSPTVTFLSDRYTYTALAPPGTLVLGRIGARAYADLFAAWRNAFVRGLEIGVGVRNAFDTPAWYPAPYDSGHAPLPGASREVMVRLRLDG